MKFFIFLTGGVARNSQWEWGVGGGPGSGRQSPFGVWGEATGGLRAKHLSAAVRGVWGQSPKRWATLAIKKK